VTAAVMARVAMPLGRLSLLDQPLGIPLHGLDLLSSRGPTAHTARGLPVSSSSHTNAPADMGTHTLYHPSPTELLGEEDDFLTFEVLPVGGTEKFDTMTGRIIAIPLPPPPTPGQVTTAAQCLRSPRLLRLPDGTVSPLVVSPVAPLNNTLPPVASNASLGLCDPLPPRVPLSYCPKKGTGPRRVGCILPTGTWFCEVVSGASYATPCRCACFVFTFACVHSGPFFVVTVLCAHSPSLLLFTAC